MKDCIFCKIIKGEIPAEKIYENEFVLVIRDIQPAAPVHVLILTKEHVESLNDITEENKHIGQEILLTAQHIAKKLGVDQSGYRVINNCGKSAGQTVMHLHFHLLGGKEMDKLLGDQ